MMIKFLDPDGFIYQLLILLGFKVDVPVSSTYDFIYFVFISLVALIFLVMFLKMLFVTMLDFFRSVRL